MHVFTFIYSYMLYYYFIICIYIYIYIINIYFTIFKNMYCIIFVLVIGKQQIEMHIQVGSKREPAIPSSISSRREIREPGPLGPIHRDFIEAIA